MNNDKLMERNAKSAGTQVKWASTKIIERDELRQSNPLMVLARDVKQRQQEQVRRGYASGGSGHATFPILSHAPARSQAVGILGRTAPLPRWHAGWFARS